MRHLSVSSNAMNGGGNLVSARFLGGIVYEMCRQFVPLLVVITMVWAKMPPLRTVEHSVKTAWDINS